MLSSKMVVFALTLIRHGETGANKENVIQGQMDVPLSENGMKQAHLIGSRLQNQRYSHIFASDLSRAKQTAQTILDKSQYTAGPIIQDPRLRERKFGEVEGKTFNDLKRLARRANQSVPSFTPSGAETVEDVRRRAVLFFQETCQLLLKNTENRSNESHEKEAKGIEVDINRFHVGTGGVKRRRHSSLVFSEDETGFEPTMEHLRNVKTTEAHIVKRERSELSSSDDESGTSTTDLLKTTGRHLETLGCASERASFSNGHGANPDQLCVYVPSRVPYFDAKTDDKLRALRSLHAPQQHQHHPQQQQVLSGVSLGNFPLVFKHSTAARSSSPTALHDDCPNVTLSPLLERKLAWQTTTTTIADSNRKASIDSSNDDFDVSHGLCGNVLIVSHGGFLRELIRHFVEDLGCTIPGGKGQALRISPNTGLSKFTISIVEDDDKPKVICLLIHDKDHLTGNGIDIYESTVL